MRTLKASSSAKVCNIKSFCSTGVLRRLVLSCVKPCARDSHYRKKTLKTFNYAQLCQYIGPLSLQAHQEPSAWVPKSTHTLSLSLSLSRSRPRPRALSLSRSRARPRSRSLYVRYTRTCQLRPTATVSSCMCFQQHQLGFHPFRLLPVPIWGLGFHQHSKVKADLKTLGCGQFNFTMMYFAL